MCEHLQFVEIVVERYGYRKEYALIDQCIVPLIKQMNQSGIATVSSCCTHGKKKYGYILDTEMCIHLVKNGEIIKSIKDGKKLYLKEFEKMGRAFESMCRKHYGFGFRYTRPYHPLLELGEMMEKNTIISRRKFLKKIRIC